MKSTSLPIINARYWTAILAASTCGANTGDFASRILQRYKRTARLKITSVNPTGSPCAGALKGKISFAPKREGGGV
jgi:hypothetical protein